MTFCDLDCSLFGYKHGWTDVCSDVEVEMVIKIKPKKFIFDPYVGHSISSFSEVARPKSERDSTNL